MTDPISGGAIAIDVGISTLERLGPTGIMWVRTKILGNKILCVGPTEAGKTSFSDYLAFGTLEQEGEHVKTLSDYDSPHLAINMGKNKSLQLRVKAVSDVRGHIGPEEHAKLVGEKRPHSIVVVFDASSTKIAEIEDWLKKFFDHLNDVLDKQTKIKRKVKSIVCVLNKYDRLKEDDFKKIKAKAQKEFRRCMASVFSNEMSRRSIVMPCVSVEVEGIGSTLIDKVVERIGKELTKS